LEEKLKNAQKRIQELLEEIRILKIEREISHGGYQKVNGRYVKYYSSRKSWAEAAETCKNAYSRLIVAKDYETVKWIRYKRTPLWIGAFDKGHEGNWTWIDGTPVVNNWNEGQPDNGKGERNHEEENCAAANYKLPPRYYYGKWSDLPCDKDIKFVCEIPDYPKKTKEDGSDDDDHHEGHGHGDHGHGSHGHGDHGHGSHGHGHRG